MDHDSVHWRVDFCYVRCLLRFLSYDGDDDHGRSCLLCDAPRTPLTLQSGFTPYTYAAWSGLARPTRKEHPNNYTAPITGASPCLPRHHQHRTKPPHSPEPVTTKFHRKPVPPGTSCRGAIARTQTNTHTLAHTLVRTSSRQLRTTPARLPGCLLLRYSRTSGTRRRSDEPRSGK